MRFLRNEDTSSIEMREFNTLSRDVYPTFTLCLHSLEGGIFNDRYLNEGFGLDGKKYQNTLRGNEKVCYLEGPGTICRKNNLYPNNISGVIFQKAIPKLSHFVYFYGVKENSNSRVFASEWSSSENKIDEEESLPLYLSYQDGKRICFTRKTKFDYGFSRRLESIRMNSTYLVAQTSLMVIIYIHYPGQTTREFGKNPVGHFDPATRVRHENQMALSQITVLRKRSDGNHPCNSKPNDDELFKKRVIENVGCIPPYWKSRAALSDLKAMPHCNSFSQLKELDRAIDNTASIMASYEPPCNQMSMNMNTNGHQQPYGNDTWGIRIKYMDEQYQEIQNKREFGLDSLGSSVGGYIGIFLGFGMLQLPDLLAQTYILLKSKLPYT